MEDGTRKFISSYERRGRKGERVPTTLGGTWYDSLVMRSLPPYCCVFLVKEDLTVNLLLEKEQLGDNYIPR